MRNLEKLHLKVVVDNVPPNDPSDSEGYGGWQLNERSRGELWHTIGVTRVATRARKEQPDYNAFAFEVLHRLQPYRGSLFGMTHESNGNTHIVVRVVPTMSRSLFKKRIVRMFERCLEKHDIIRKPIISEIVVRSVK